MLSNKEKQIFNTFWNIVLNMTDLEKEKLLAFGEGMAFMIEQKNLKSCNE